jgi:hypothetical protein
MKRYGRPVSIWAILLPMQKLSVVSWFISCIVILSACSKHGAPTPTPVPPVNIPRIARPLLDSMVWKQYATTAYFAYRADSLQDKITTVSPGVSDTVHFEYNGRQISRIYNLRLNRESDYVYDAAGKIVLISMTGYANLAEHYVYEYGYDATGRLSSNSYSVQTGADKQLITSSTYEYDANGLPSKIKGTTPEGVSFAYTIDTYTEECNFNPWVFIEELDPAEGFEIYNLPDLYYRH